MSLGEIKQKKKNNLERRCRGWKTGETQEHLHQEFGVLGGAWWCRTGGSGPPLRASTGATWGSLPLQCQIVQVIFGFKLWGAKA